MSSRAPGSCLLLYTDCLQFWPFREHIDWYHFQQQNSYCSSRHATLTFLGLKGRFVVDLMLCCGSASVTGYWNMTINYVLKYGEKLMATGNWILLRSGNKRKAMTQKTTGNRQLNTTNS